MSCYQFELATAAEDLQLRSILAQTPMPGIISVAFGREPSYFGASVVEGPFRQAMVVRDTRTGQLVGLGARSISLRYVNGEPVPIGYLSNLRLLEGHRQKGLLGRGYQFLRQLHQDGRAGLYLTTIAEDNAAALSSLTSGHLGMPGYYPLGRYHTLAISTTRRRPLASAMDIRQARASDLPAIVHFTQSWGAKRQFFPCYQSEDFFAQDGILRGLQAEDLFLAMRDGQIAGMLAAWDQRMFRQNVVCGYGWPLSLMRPAYNAWATIAGGPKLPRPGEAVRCVVGALPLVADDDPLVLGALLDHVLQQKPGERDYVLLGLHESDPLLAAVEHRRARRYTTRIFAVCWEDGEQLRRSLQSRPLYLELGSL